ncbi:MAG TPA: DUF4349 domain-containing protein, partial [Symbiobacteriaceae bacterium]|nr:DUF4349 domain-containing protein [Symbiobacteriaceae bacterium]
LKLLANRVEYSTISISLTQPAPGQAAQIKPEPRKGVWAQMIWAFSESLRVIGNLGRGFVVGLAASAPFVVGAAILAALALGVRWFRRRRG